NLVFSSGAPATVTLEDGTAPVDVRAGDLLRGVYLFDNVKVASAILQSRDLLVSTNAPVVDATSQLIAGNTAIPKIDTSKITYTRGLLGAVITGAAGAVTDVDQPLVVTARNTTRTLPKRPTLQVLNSVAADRTIGGYSVLKLNNGNNSQGSAGFSIANVISGTGFVQWRASSAA